MLFRSSHPEDKGHHEDTEGWIDRVYVATLPGLLRRPWMAFLFALLLAGAGAAAYFAVGSGFLPHADEGGFVIDYITPAGSSLEATDTRMKKVEDLLRKTPEVESFIRRTGSEMGMFATQLNTGDLLVRLKPRGQRKRSAEQVLEGLRDQFAKAVPDTEIEFVQLLQDMLGDLEGAPNPIEIKIFGDDQQKLNALAEDIAGRLEKVTGVVDIVGVQEGSPQVDWRIDPVAAARIGLTVQQVATQLSDAWLGDVATELRLFDRTIPVRVRYPDAVRLRGSRLESTAVRGSDKQLVPAASLATLTDLPPEPEIIRENLKSMAIITGRLEERDLGSAARSDRFAVA